jgi:DnaJ-domain-containing protein 1
MHLNIECPFCSKRSVETACKVSFVHGFLFFSQQGSKTLVGCKPCVRGKIVENSVGMLFLGWWSIMGFILTPFLLLENLLKWLQPENEGFLRYLLKQQGIAVEDVEVDVFGHTREQRLLTEGILSVLTEAVWADGSADEREIELGVHIAGQMLDETVVPWEVRGRLRSGETSRLEVEGLSAQQRILVFRAAMAIVVADERIDPGELNFLLDLARRMEMPQGLLDELLSEIGLYRERRWRGRPPPRREPRGALEEAAKVLGVAVDATLQQAKRAYRRMAMLYHPDRNKDGEAEKATAQMARLNWAYEQFLARGRI